MSIIQKIYAREVLDSRGNPTVEVDVYTNNSFGRAIVPSGASTGIYEALELRDNEERFGGKGVKKAVDNVNKIIAPELIGLDVTKQILIDKIMIELDGTENKSKLGANAILGVSLACAKAGANYYKMPLYNYLGGFNAQVMPLPMMNILNGGAHADFCIDFQEIMIIPIGADSMKKAIQMGAEVFHCLKKILKQRNYVTSVGDEGGYAPNLSSNEEAFELVIEAIKLAKYNPGTDIALGIDAAASEFYNKITNTYILKKDNKEFNAKELVDNYYCKLIKKYPLISIEDGLEQDDWDGWKYLTEKLGKKIQIVGDDLFVTNAKRLEKGIKMGVANGIIIKVNQIGTLSETFATIEMAKKANYGVIISHRSGESEETIYADIAVGINAGQIKTGSLSRTDRISKYNQLIRIEEELNLNNRNIKISSFSKKTN